MMKTLQKLLFVTLVAMISLACTSDRDTYFERPKSLEGTLYQQIESTPNCSEYIKCLQITGYAEIFARGGSYTLFVPTDEAFAAFCSENEYEGVDKIPVDKLKEIIEGLTLNYAFSKERLLEWSSFEHNWRNDARSFRKKTILKRYVREDEKLIALDRKFIPLFTNQYFDFRTSVISGIKYDKSCYEYFYPSIQWTGLNLADAHITTNDIAAENGFFYGIDKVVSPLDNMVELLATHTNFSTFYSLLKKFVKYEESASETELIGGTEQVYKKIIELNGNIASDEMLSRDHSAFNMFSIAVPGNKALDKYIKDQILSMGYTAIDEVPLVVWRYLLNTHLKVAGANASYYPIDLKTETGVWGKVDYNNPAEVSYHKFASNGPVYGLERVLESPVLNGVARTTFLKPDYRLFINALELSGNLSLLGSDLYTLIGVSNKIFTDAGYTFNEESRVFYKNDVVVTADELRNLVNNQVFVNSCDADHEVGMYAKSLAGLYVKFAAGRVSGSEQSIALTDKTKYDNGYFYDAQQLLPLFTQADLKVVVARQQYAEFKKLMKQSNFDIDQIRPEITSNENIFFIPSNQAVNTAIANGLLPASTPYTPAEKAIVQRFIRNSIVPSDLYFTSAAFSEKNLNTLNGESISLENKDGRTITIKKGRKTAHSVAEIDNVNNLAAGGWAVHSIDVVLID